MLDENDAKKIEGKKLIQKIMDLDKFKTYQNQSL